MINTNEQTIFPTTYVDQSDPSHPVTYTTKNGFALADLNKDYTEWEMRDLRSYQQRPAIKLSKLIETICRKENSGYEVTFDESFFTEANPYWSKTFVALPLLGTTTDESAVSNYATVSPEKSDLRLGSVPSEYTPYWSNSTNISVNGKSVSTTNGIINMSAFPINSAFNIDVDFSLFAKPNSYTSSDRLYISTRYGYLIDDRDNYHYYNHPQAISAQVIAYDADSDEVIGYSNQYYFTNPIGGSYISSPDNWIDYNPRTNAANVQILGEFRKSSDRYYFQSDKGNDTFRLTLNKVARADRVKLVLYVDWHRSSKDTYFGLYESTTMLEASDEKGISSYETFDVLTRNGFEISYDSPVLSGATITKDMLLKTENSPADFLLSFSKLFGLYYVKDVVDKKISIYSRPSYFISTVNNWDERIDKSKNMTVTPTLFDKKWYRMSLDTPETYFASKYNKKYDMIYGQKRLNTGYNFNSETTDLYEGNIYQNVVTALDSDKYYRTFYTSNNESVPCFVNDNLSYTLYNQLDGYTQDIYGATIINPNNTVE